MGTITLSSEDSGSNSILSNIFIDYYMPEANGTFVKVYLYLLRLQQSNRQMCSLSEVADHLNCTDNDVSRAIKYWIGKGLLQYSQDEKGNPIGLILCQPQSPEALGQTPRIVDFHLVRPEEPKTSTGKKTSRKQPTVRELQKALEDPQFLELRAQAEAYFDRPLSDKDINALWFIYDDLKLPFGLCEYLLEYCAEDKGKHPERMEADYYRKIASSWAEQGITSREDAQRATSRRFFGTQLLRALGIRDRYIPTDAEVRMIEDWRTRFGFSDEMLILACETALRRKPGSVGFDYVQGILDGWHKQGIQTPEDVERLDRNRTSARTTKTKNTQKDFIQGSLADDLDLIEQLSIKKAKES